MKSFKVIFAVALTLGAAYYLTSSKNEESSSKTPTTSNEALQVSPDSSNKNLANEKSREESQKNQDKLEDEKQQEETQLKQDEELGLSTLQEFDEISEEQKLSLIQNSKIMREFAVRQTRSDTLVERLRDLEAKPLVMNDENPYTGSMKVVRTRSPFPGTRYFHAQYFDNEQNEEYVQHMSFEFRPGDQSFEAVKKSIKTAFKLGEPLEDKENFISWRQGEDYVVWIKKMDLKDMKDDPFNAYSKEDVGTIRVAKELEIHDQAPSFHMQQGEPENQKP